MDLSIIIVNYNTPELTINCISSIFEQTTTISFEIIVVDNNSSDNSKNLICTAHPQIKFITVNYNSGFARANNKGIKAASANTILLLNSDTIVIEKSIDVCYDYLKQQNTTVACGCQLLNADRSDQISGGYNYQHFYYCHTIPILNRLTTPIFNKFRKYTRLRNSKNETLTSANNIQSVDWIMGAFIMIKKSAIEKAGMLDEDFFMYAEEIEWCNRLKMIGKLVLVKTAKTIHLVGSSTQKEYATKKHSHLGDKRERQRILSILLMIRKSFGVKYYFIMLAIFVLGLPFYFLRALFCLKKAGSAFKEACGYSINVWIWLSNSIPILLNRKKFYKI